MQKFIAFYLIFSVIFSFSAWADKKPVITIAADSWCPINCVRPETRLGVGIDLAKAVFEPLGYEIDYRVMSWSEALNQVRAGTVDAVIGASRLDERRLVFPEKHIMTITDDFYVLKGDGWRFQGVHTLKGRALGAIEGYGYGKVVSDYIKANANNSQLVKLSTGEHALSDNIKKLIAREVTVVVETKPVMEYTLAKQRMEGRIEHVGSVPQAPVYLAFSPALPKSKILAGQYDAGIAQLDRAGKLKAFYSAYGLSSYD